MTATDIFFFCLGFFPQPILNHRTADEGGGHFFNYSLPLPTTLHTVTYQLWNYFRALTSANSQRPVSNQELQVSELKPLTTELCTVSILLDLLISKLFSTMLVLLLQYNIVGYQKIIQIREITLFLLLNIIQGSRNLS